MYCDYGCGQPYNYTLKNGKKCCSARTSSCPEQKKKNAAGLRRAYLTGVKKPTGEVYKGLPESTKQRMNWNKGNYSNTLFVYRCIYQE